MRSIEKGFFLFRRSVRTYSTVFLNPISRCQSIRSKMSIYSEQGVKVSKKMSIYQYPKKIIYVFIIFHLMSSSS